MRCLGGMLAVLAAGIFVGCGGGSSSKVKVAGTLTWDDGTPIAQAQVDFIPVAKDGMGASGFTEKDGSFELTTSNSGDGALPGDYKVVVSKRVGDVGGGKPPAVVDPKEFARMMEEFAKKAASKGALKSTAKSEIPAIYSTKETTTLKWKVESGGPRVELKLKKA